MSKLFDVRLDRRLIVSTKDRETAEAIVDYLSQLQEGGRLVYANGVFGVTEVIGIPLATK